MTAAEERILRAAINPWPLNARTIGRSAGRSEVTVRKHLANLRRHKLVRRYNVEHPSRGREAAYMATEAGHAAILSIDSMRGAS